jgi:hypothetical protein
MIAEHAQHQVTGTSVVLLALMDEARQDELGARSSIGHISLAVEGTMNVSTCASMQGREEGALLRGIVCTSRVLLVRTCRTSKEGRCNDDLRQGSNVSLWWL